ncbi:MAG TPA: class I SAM-dependent methyltransferase, partial [Blastocatellia bacterium]|nr:class I SAM-dependent methyltransferase [Blastocatellia bacterium]
MARLLFNARSDETSESAHTEAVLRHPVPQPFPGNTVLDEITKTGQTILPTGEQVTATSYIDASCGALLQAVINELRPAVGVEVGLAFGISTLYILEALSAAGGDKLIGMDPAQHDGYWRGGGLHNIQRAGYESLYEFHENTSQQVLPALVARGQRVDFAFIDGWHTFDHVLIDFFYIDQMLETGGIVVFDDVGYPSIKRACDFIVTNRDYEVHGCVRLKTNNSLARTGKHLLGRVLNPL